MKKNHKVKGNSKNKTNKHQFYKMKGCSSKCTRRNKHYLGGTNILSYASPMKPVGADFNLAYPYNGPVKLNESLAYTGKGGNSLYPSTGPPINGFNFLNPINQQKGGSGCGCGMPFMSGGKKNDIKHRNSCKCSLCKLKMNGGSCSTSNNGIPYPNGLVGNPYVNPTNLPGVNGIVGDANYYSNNTYNNDISRNMENIGANPPFLGIRGGKKRNTSKKMRGGNFSNFLGQDLLNLGRQFGHNIGSAFNSLNGYTQSVNPLPWKNQLVTKN